MGDTSRNVFISYARQDALEFAKRLATDLEEAGHEVFVDLTGIAKGALWEVRLEAAIRSSDILASVLTFGALLEDSVCRDEVVFALNEGKSVIPLRLNPSPNLKPSLLLARRNWIDFSTDYDSGLQSLLRHFRGDSSALRPPPIPMVTGVVPLDFGPEIARLTAGFTGRAWLKRELDQWLNNSEGRAIVIIGEPGIGKSAIAAWLSVVFQKQTISIHFCTDRNSRTLQPFEFVASLVGQLCTQVDGFAETVVLRQPEVRRLSANDAFRELVVEPARRLTRPPNPLIVVLDSLDEAIRKEGETLLDVLVNQAHDLPPWLRIVATARPDEQVLRRIRLLHTFELRADRKENESDVTQYIGERLNNSPLGDRLSEESVKLVAERLPELAKGNFLYARMALDALEAGTFSAQDMGILSPGMSDFYLKIFSRLFPTEAVFAKEAQPILRVLSVAMEPLPFAIIDRVSRLKDETQEVTNLRLRRLRSYLRVSGKGLDGAKYALFHKSLSDWLTDPDAAGSFWCFPERGKEQLAEACWQDYENDPERMTEYALRYAILHLRDIRKEADAKTLSQDETFRRRRTQLGLSSFFLSYAKGDDDTFVSKFHHDLTSQGFDIWFDRELLPGRASVFLREVREALDDYDRLVIVVGPNALKSDYVVAEWQYAINSGKAVTPVLRIGEYNEIPEELRQYHVLDARPEADYKAAVEEFRRIVTEPIPPLGPLFGVPSLPPAYVARRALVRELMDTMLGDTADSNDVVIVIGMGGIGKTVLAAAFARTTVVRRAFPKGIFWLSFGPHADIARMQQALLYSLGDAARISTAEEGRARLRLLLANECALIVLDDVWDASAAGAFTRIGRRCRTVVTTRNRDVATVLGGKVLITGAPSEGDTEKLLAQLTGLQVENLPPAAHEVLKEVGHLPLAITLAAALLRDGISWADLLNGLRSGLAYFSDPNAPYQHGSITSLFRMSYDFLPEDAQKRLIEIASALSEGSCVTVSAIARLWASAVGMNEHKTRQMLSLLSNRGFIQVDGSASEERRISLHPLIHQFLRETSV